MLNISMLEDRVGIIKNKFSSSMLDEWQSIFKKNNITKTMYGDNCWGIDIKCLSYNSEFHFASNIIIQRLN